MPWGAIASIGGALIGAGAISDASSAQSGATQAGTEEQRRQFDIAQQNQAPWLAAGKTSLDDLMRRIGSGDLTRKFTLEDFWADPVTKASYQAGLDLGTQSLKNMAGARGNLNSGATLKDLTRFATDYTGGQAAGSQQRFVGDQANVYNRLAGIAGTGQTAATQTGNAAMTTGINIANMLTAQGNARGAAAIAQGNLFGGAAQNIGNWWQGNQVLNRLYPQNTPTALMGQPNYYSGVAGGYG